MTILLYILAGIGGVLLLVLIIGFFTSDKEKEIQDVSEVYESTDLKAYKAKQKEQLEQLYENAPSIIRSSVIMWLVQVLSALASLFVIIIVIMLEYNDEIPVADKPVFYLGVVIIFLIFQFVRILARMIRTRNGYIMKLEEVITGNLK